MKVVTYKYQDRREFERVMEIVKNAGIITNSNDPDKNLDDFIFIEYNGQLYKFNRYDNKFIEKVEEAIRTNPFAHCPLSIVHCPLSIVHCPLSRNKLLWTFIYRNYR